MEWTIYPLRSMKKLQSLIIWPIYFLYSILYTSEYCGLMLAVEWRSQGQQIIRIHLPWTMNNKRSFNENLKKGFANIMYETKAILTWPLCKRKGQEGQQNLYKSTSGDSEYLCQFSRNFVRQLLNYVSIKEKLFKILPCYLMMGHIIKAEHRAEVVIKGTLHIPWVLISSSQPSRSLKTSFFFHCKGVLWQTCWPRQWKQTCRRNAAKNPWAGGNIQQAEEKQLL